MNTIYYQRQSLRRKKVRMLSMIKYDRLKTIKQNPRKIMLENVETGEIKTIPSIYKWSKFIDQAPHTITYRGKKEGAWNNKYWVVVQ